LKTFSGFPSGKVRQVSLPEPVLTELVVMIDDLAELKLTLHALWRLGQQYGRVRYLRHSELAGDAVLLASLGGAPDEALARAVSRGTLLRVEAAVSGGAPELLYFANTPKGRAAVEAIGRGGWPEGAQADEPPDVFVLYEQNIGALTPLIAEALREAERTYPPEWIEDAFREAVAMNKRRWKYVEAILKRWGDEGRDDEAGGRTGTADGRRFIKGEYSDLIEH
jgi:DnaD/phage-associated family protein